MKRIISAALVAGLLCGCATNPKDIAPAYVSTSGYQNMTCDQLRTEAKNVSSHAVQANGDQSKKASGDAAMMGVGLIIFWPALLFMKGDGTSAAEVSRLKGEMSAIEDVNRVKNCGITFAAN